MGGVGEEAPMRSPAAVASVATWRVPQPMVVVPLYVFAP
jgi:hypothetical protein